MFFLIYYEGESSKGKNKMVDNDKVPELTNGEFDEFIKKGLVLVDFYAEWCMPCLMMSPVIDEMSEKFKGKIRFGKVNVDDNQEIAKKFQVVSIPNMKLIRDGRIIDEFVGGMTADDFEKKLEKFVRN